MKIPLLVTDRLWAPLQNDLDAVYDTRILSEVDNREAFLKANADRYEALVCASRTGLSKALINALPRLKVISNFGVGLDTLDVGHARRSGIAFGYTAGVLTDCVADLAFGLIIDAARRISVNDRYVRRGDWSIGKPVRLSTRVSGKNLGIVGYGRIGQAVAERAAGFRMDVRYHSHAPSAAAPHTHMDRLDALAEWADFLVVAVPGGDDTRHLISREVLASLGPQGLLINISRGSVVDEDSLIQALQSGDLGGAGLDVYQHEPQVPAALIALDNVVLSPHQASSTLETRYAMAGLVLRNLESFFKTGSVVCGVD
ncbi:2-hydroxyacid dehydrogenase [Paracandidimonas soli]|uniref:Lactate dehydrogenase-like 2-hydroxyacid dehydrogenase n=1 Tax=Paracandidimonas soli TaxID=1917182 RepID=A0A4R3V187_9BURK|nr:2-hydroxyacid dehydrogenase [Paracandidimonas soli]TCU98496.1 lactate dehydrogenase-like 2-hydroxyacid dehydrogenase [Paracandidimonas soli]